jgi:cyclophilin family peptidyl-prolyl cis-trans isomerase
MVVLGEQTTLSRTRPWLALGITSAAVISAGLWVLLRQGTSRVDSDIHSPVAPLGREQNPPPPKPQLASLRHALLEVPTAPVAAKAEVKAPPRGPVIETKEPTPKVASTMATDPPRVRGERVVLRTIAGDIVLAFYPDVAPETVRQMLRLAGLGVFDTMHFGDMQPGFYLQLYNPEERLVPMSEQTEKSLTPIKGELSHLHHRRGTLSMPAPAKDDPDGAVCAFSIMLGDASHVDGKQTVFGHVESGMDVLDRFEQVPLWGSTHRPEVRLTILQAEVVAEDALPQLVLEPARPIADILHDGPLATLAVRATDLLKQRCISCHGREKPAGGLNLTSQADLFRGGKHGPAIYRRNALSSPLRQRITAADASAMPRDGLPLRVAEIALLTAWIDAGADYPPGWGPLAPEVGANEVETVSTEEAAFWSFAPLQTTTPPAVKDSSLIRTSIDRYLLAALEQKELAFNAPADRRTLIRRLSFDLLGLPPAPEEIDRFVADRALDAYEQLVDRLLASPRFGEHQARDWLDVARYADSGGYEDDDNRPYAYTYRDFVIRALNDDLPFDTFVRWQIAGDELAPDNRQALAATGFATAGPLQTFFPRKRERYDELDDIVSTFGSAMLGLPVGCARCHDHKNDPIPQRDYYRLQAVFAGSRREERTLAPDDGSELRRQIDYFRKASARLEHSLRAPALNRKIGDLPIPEADKALLHQPLDPGNSRQAELLHKHRATLQVSDAEMFPDPDDRVALMRLTSQLDELQEKKLPKGLTLAGSGYGRSYFLERGDPDRERDAVPPGFLTVLTRGRPAWKQQTWKRWAGRAPGSLLPQPRRALANWLTDIDGGAGRLVARVIVNRLWLHHFGEGLVRTPNDFGSQGDRPSNPELLDWLAGELIARGWHLKAIHRLMVTSTAYRQSSILDPEKSRVDPENRLFGRHLAQRLSAEAFRDALLAVGGNMNAEMYGPGIKPPIPLEAIFPTAPKHGEVWPADAEDGPANWRRSIYVICKRSNPVPFMQTFDSPDASASCARRSATTVPTQALLLMNDPFVVSQSRRFAERVKSAADTDPGARVSQAYRFALGRPPDAAESEKAIRFLSEYPLADFCQVLVQSSEFAYID